MKKPIFKVTIYFLNEAASEIEANQLEDIVKGVITTDVINGLYPIYIDINGQKLLYSRKLYTSYMKDGDYRNFLIYTEITGVCRNKKIMKIDGNEVEANSLWWRKGDRFYLADDDRFVDAFYDVKLFTDKV